MNCVAGRSETFLNVPDGASVLGGSRKAATEPPPQVLPAVFLETGDPWAWSLDNAIGAVGAAGSLLVALLAVLVPVVMWRRDRAERLAREVVDSRGRVGIAMLRYFESALQLEEKAQYSSLQESLAASKLDRSEWEPLEKWLVESTETARYLFLAAFPSGVRSWRTTPNVWPFLAAEASMRSFILEWMAVGAGTPPRIFGPEEESVLGDPRG